MKGDVAYLNISSFQNDEGLQLFLKNREVINNAKGLIIDVRYNGGGTSGWEILRYLTNKPFETTASQERILRGVDMARERNMFEWSLPTTDKLEPADKNPFLKPVIVLIGPRTFSAAEDFVAVFKQMKRGILVGEATGGSTGQPFGFDLPGGGTARICVKRDSFVNGEEFVGYGIQPDVEVKQDVQSIINGKDVVLLKALNLLNKK
jgi:C-terminal processing protease CtpA/Prc